MKYRYFGQTGLKISEISLGTQTFGWNTKQDEAFRMLDYYFEMGGSYLDTADSYNNGESERILGAWLKERGNHDDLIISTKVFFDQNSASKDSNRIGHSKKHIINSLEKSLSRLGLEAIDLYQLHCFDKGTDLEEVIDTMEDLIRSGKILYYGVSNFAPSSIAKIATISRFKQYHHLSSLQLEYSLLVRSPEWELLPLCYEENIGTLAWSPLAGGWLTGKYKRDEPPPENSRAGRKDRWYDQPEQRGGPRTWAILDVLGEISTKRKVPVSQAALNWVRKKKTISSVLIGARNMDQLKENLASLAWDMSEEEEIMLNDVSNIQEPYPYSFISMYSRESFK